MIARFGSLPKVMHYLLKYRRNVSFRGLPAMQKYVTIKLTNGYADFGKGITLKSGNYFSVLNNGKLTIEDNVYFGRNCTIVCHNAVTIGKKCAFGPNVTIYDPDHRFGLNGIEEGFRAAPVIIGDNCWIGAGSIILRGTRIGDGSVIGAGTVVKGTIPPHSIVTSGRDLCITPIKERD